MRVTMLAKTEFNDDAAERISGWEPDPEATDAASLAEFAGRVCYGSFNKPNPDTATNEGYLRHILQVHHYTLVEHGTVSFHLGNVSRSFTHELIRHRHNSYSQLSQRFVIQGTPIQGEDPFITPPLFRGDDIAGRVLQRAWQDAMDHYDMLMSLAETKLEEVEDSTSRKKQAREAARCVLPNMTPTAIVVTANHSAWRDFISKRATMAADAEIREVAVEIFRQLSEVEPNIYRDMQIMYDIDTDREYVATD